MTITEDNKTVVSDFIGALFTKGDPSAVDDYLAEDFVNHDPPFGASADREGMRSAGAMFRAVFPDWRSDLHLLVAEGDIVVEMFTATGTHTGTEIMGVAPSGRTVYAAAAQVLADEHEETPSPNATRLPRSDGGWISVHASRLNGTAGYQIGTCQGV